MQKSKGKRGGARLFFTLVLTLFALVLFVLTVLVARAAVGLDPEEDVALLDQLSTIGTTRLYLSDGEEYEMIYAAENRIWWSSEEIPEVVRGALVLTNPSAARPSPNNSSRTCRGKTT